MNGPHNEPQRPGEEPQLPDSSSRPSQHEDEGAPSTQTGPPAAAQQGESPRRRRLSRRGVLGLVGVGAVAVTGATAGGVKYAQDQQEKKAAAAAAVGGTPQPMHVITDTSSASPGDLFYTDMREKGSSALVQARRHGALAWTQGGARSYADFRIQTYQGRPVYTYWESPTTGLDAYAEGFCVVTDLQHNEVARIGKIDGAAPDEHEFLLTDRGTAYTTSYVRVQADLSSIGGPSSAAVMDSLYQEVDLASGKIIHRWSALDHVDLEESYAGYPEDPDEPYDFFHINSIEPCPDGTLLISARHTWAFYKVDPDSGRILWRLNGKRSDFQMPFNATFAWQHDVRRQDDGLIRIFDNGSDGNTFLHHESQILWLDIDERRKTVRLDKLFRHPKKVSAHAMGNAQLLPDGNVMVGWGTAKRMSEFSPKGDIVFDATLPEMSYRTYRMPVPVV